MQIYNPLRCEIAPGYICVAPTHDIPRHCGTVAHRRGIGITDVLASKMTEGALHVFFLNNKSCI